MNSQEVAMQSKDIQALLSTLKRTQLTAHHLPAGDQFPFDQLVILRQNTRGVQNKPLLLNFAFLDDILASSGMGEMVDGTPILQITSLLFWDQPSESQLQGLSYLLTRLNKMIPIGCFSLADDDQVFYRYNLICEIRNISADLLLDVINMIEHLILSSFPLIQDYINGQTSLENALEELSSVNAN